MLLWFIGIFEGIILLSTNNPVKKYVKKIKKVLD